jgi:hypothetical protein
MSRVHSSQYQQAIRFFYLLVQLANDTSVRFGEQYGQDERLVKRNAEIFPAEAAVGI